MKKYLIGMGESRVLINKNELNIRGEFDILVLKNSNYCCINNIKANEIYLFNSDFNLINGSIISRFIIHGRTNTITRNLGNYIEIIGNDNLITGNISKRHKNDKP